MYSRRILLQSNSTGNATTHRGIPAPPGFPDNRTAAANSSSSSSSPPSDDDPYDFNTRFNPSMAIIIVVLLSAFFFMGFFSIYVRRCTRDEDNDRASRRGRTGGNANGRAGRASQGLDREVIDTFPIFSYSLVKGLKKGRESLECAVCLSEFEEDESLRMLPKCSHTFHPDCIDMWLQSHTTCPVCRTSLVPGDGSRRDQGTASSSEDAEAGSANGSHPGSIPLNGECSSRRSHDSPILGLINSVGGFTRQKIRRSNSTGHSLVRTALGGSGSKPGQLAALGHICGIPRSSSCVIFSPQSQDPSNCAGPSTRAPALGDESRNVDPRVVRSERFGFSMNPPFSLRTYSERRPEVRLPAPKPVQQDGNAYMQSLRRSLKWLTGRDPGAGSSRASKTEVPNP